MIRIEIGDEHPKAKLIKEGLLPEYMVRIYMVGEWYVVYCGVRVAEVNDKLYMEQSIFSEAWNMLSVDDIVRILSVRFKEAIKEEVLGLKRKQRLRRYYASTGVLSRAKGVLPDG